jgi:nicotinamide phosphoribosyltransferase
MLTAAESIAELEEYSALLSDSYKYSHDYQLPTEVNSVHSYLEARKAYQGIEDLIIAGQPYIFSRVLRPIDKQRLELFEALINEHMGSKVFNKKAFDFILRERNGRPPINIWGYPEGTRVKVLQPILAVENTLGKQFRFLGNFYETLLQQLYFPITVASYSAANRVMIKSFLDETCDLPENIKELILSTRLHDFGMRGGNTFETSALGGVFHLLSFDGTDTTSSLLLSNFLYPEKDWKLGDKFVCNGFSIPASEHLTITSWTQGRESQAYRNILKTFNTGYVACVSDSYDIVNAARIWGDELKYEVIARDGVLVIRLDSGDPVYTCNAIFEKLWDYFGGRVNSLGYRVLADKVRLIQGDGINYSSTKEILSSFKNNKIAAENIAFGSGGALIQKHDRDSFSFAFKASEVTNDNGEIVKVHKEPMEFTKTGEYIKSFKVSKTGRFFDDSHLLVKDGEMIMQVPSFSELRKKVR